jgi:hypothetical protein
LALRALAWRARQPRPLPLVRDGSDEGTFREPGRRKVQAPDSRTGD